MKHLLFLLLFPSLLFAQEPLTYTIHPVFPKSGGLRLSVEISFQGTVTGQTYLNYQNNQFGEPNQMDFILFPAQDPGVEVEKQPDSNRFLVKHLPGKRVRVRYEVLDLQGATEAFYQYCCYKPILHQEYFHIQPGHLLATPEGYWTDPEDRQPVQFRWEGFPENWTLHNSFGPDRSQTATLTNSQFSVAVFVGGDFRRFSFKVKNQPVYLLTRGSWTQFSDDTLQNLLQRTVEGHRAFWNDYSDTIYTVSFLPIDDAPWTETSKSVSVGGSGLTNSFMSFATNNPGVKYDLIRYVWVHELMHHWIGVHIQNAEEEKQYWFSEGFTEYFTLKNSLRYGLISTEQFLTDLNTFSSEHYSSSKRQMPNDSMNYERFWNGGKEWEKLPYRRGCLFAFYLDNLLREKSKGASNLDQMMREILAITRKNPDQKLDHRFFRSMVRKYGGKKAEKNFVRFIEKGELIDFTKSKLPEGMEVTIRDLTMNFGPSPDVITRTEVLKDIPVFRMKNGATEDAVKAAVLK
jgi:predicted metalloprotease with PDZ domain